MKITIVNDNRILNEIDFMIDGKLYTHVQKNEKWTIYYRGIKKTPGWAINYKSGYGMTFDNHIKQSF